MTTNNDRTLIVGKHFSGKTYLLLKIFSRIPNRDIDIVNKAPPDQYSNSKIKIKEIGEEITPLKEYENAIIVSHDNLGTSKGKYIDQFIIGCRQNYLSTFHISQSYFHLPKRYEIRVTKLFCLIKHQKI